MADTPSTPSPSSLSAALSTLEASITAQAITLPAPLIATLTADFNNALPAIETDIATMMYTEAEQAIGALATKISTDIINYYTNTCFVSGTRIRTRRGEIAVEALTTNDQALTAGGKYRKIRWIGRKTVSCRTHREPRSVQPIRIAAHAFGTDRPDADLLLSPGHALCVTMMDEIFIPASALVNGSTVAQLDVAEVTYWHVELDRHDVILANNLPAESYLECGNRAWFEQPVDLEQRQDAPEIKASYCRPFVDRGPLVVACRDQLKQRALQLGWTLDPMAGLHLMSDGRRVEPTVEGDLVRFVVPAGASDVRLASGTFVPAWVEGGDERTLGICIRKLGFADGLGCAIDIPFDHPDLAAGFHPGEAERGLDWRWTNGELTVPVSVLRATRHDAFLSIETAQSGDGCWIAPQGEPIADEATPRSSRAA